MGAPVGEVRLVIEAGATGGRSARFPVRQLLGRRPVSASTLLEMLPQLTADLTASLERIKAREERDAYHTRGDV